MTARAICGLVIDKTGSMSGVAQQAINSINEYIDTMRTDAPDATIIIATFNSCTGLAVLRRGVAKTISNVSMDEYQPDCMTPLIDSMVDMINMLKEEANDGDRVILVVMTDGEENYSTRYKLDDLKKKVKKAKKRGWEVAFLGANMDSFGFGGNVAVAAGSTMNWDYSTLEKSMRAVTLSTVTAATDSSYTAGEFFSDTGDDE